MHKLILPSTLLVRVIEIDIWIDRDWEGSKASYALWKGKKKKEGKKKKRAHSVRAIEAGCIQPPCFQINLLLSHWQGGGSGDEETAAERSS